MTSDLTSTTPFAADCATFEERLMAYRERELDATTAAWMVRHQQACRVCETLMRDLDALVEQAAVLPTMSPSRDLWPDVLSRLDAPVVPLSTRFTPAASLTTATGSRRGVSIRMFAVAATMLVAVSSAVTWQVARSRGAAAADSTASANLLAARADVRPDTRSLQPVANADADVVYEQEIAALRDDRQRAVCRTGFSDGRGAAQQPGHHRQSHRGQSRGTGEGSRQSRVVIVARSRAREQAGADASRVAALMRSDKGIGMLSDGWDADGSGVGAAGRTHGHERAGASRTNGQRRTRYQLHGVAQ
jgi:hypothetical protein